jgi:hypothetical protein
VRDARIIKRDFVKVVRDEKEIGTVTQVKRRNT